ncbi:MAG: Lrp/AsnC ligand binding domain-containing protein [Thermoplasmata archaeon]|nr:Lrp/AsnC ligand binding domain-containing protein [Thermoplasmata archaeon]
MVDEKSRQLTLFVQSKKVVTSFYRPSAARMMTTPEASDTSSKVGGDEGAGSAEEAYFLSDDQAHALAMAEETAARRGYRIRVVDVGKAGIFTKLVAEHLRGVERFPVLIGATGQRLEGTESFSEERLCDLMPTEMFRLRAFTYVKVRGGDLDRIRDIVLAYPEVRELHLLTGDWDVFIVLEFKEAHTRKRQVLQFVTEKIRGLPEVVDTSTLVPEYSVSKFPMQPARSGPGSPAG